MTKATGIKYVTWSILLVLFFSNVIALIPLDIGQRSVVDYILITREVDGDVLEGGNVPPGYVEWGYLSAYNHTEGFVGNLNGDWEASGDASLLSPEYGSHNGINVGYIPGDVWFNVTDEFDNQHGVRYTVITHGPDHIRITDSPGGEPISDETVSVGTLIRGYCSVYNESSGYLYNVEGNWSAQGGDSELMEDAINRYNVLHVGYTEGPVWFNVSYQGMHHSVLFNVMAPGVDEIYITQEPGGEPLMGGDVPVGTVIQGYASGYNSTTGYVGTVDANWTVEFDPGMDPSTDPGPGGSSWLNVGTQEGFITWFASYHSGESWYNTSVDFKVEPPNPDRVSITRDGEEVPGGSVPVGYTLEVELSAYNHTTGFLYLVEGEWSVEGGDAELLNGTVGQENTLHVGTTPGEVWLNASYDGLEHSVSFHVMELGVDEIRITDSPGGEPFTDIRVPVGTVIQGHASSYNSTVGYVGTVDAYWTVEYEPGMDPATDPGSGTWSSLNVGTQGGLLTWTASYSGGRALYNHSVVILVDPPNPDRVSITRYGEEVPGGSVPVGYTLEVELSAYNHTTGFLYMAEGEWSVEGGDAELLDAVVGRENTLLVGTIPGEVWLKARYGELVDSVLFVVQDPSVDRIEFLEDPNDPLSVIDDREIFIDQEFTIYSGGFNHSIGFLGPISVEWSVENTDGAEAWVDPTVGESTTFSAGTERGAALLRGVYTEGRSHSLMFTISPHGMDLILIRSEPGGGGDALHEIHLAPDESVHMYAAGYNNTHGFLEDVYAVWDLDDETVGDLGALSGVSVSFTALEGGYCNVTAEHEGMTFTTLVVVDSLPVPEIVGKIPDIEMERNFGIYELDLGDHAYDPHEEMMWYITGTDDSVIRVFGENQTGNHILTFSSQNDAHGSMHVRYWLVNSAGQRVYQRAWINVTYTYTPPRFRRCPDLHVRFDEPYEFSYEPYIIYEYDRLHELVLETDDPEHTTVRGLKVTYEYPESMLDQEILVVISVTDGLGSDYTAITVTVSSNYPPVIVEPLPDLEIEQGELKENVFNLDDHFVDPEGEQLYMSYGYTYLTITIHGDNTVDIRADTVWYGVERVTFRAKDPVGAIREQTINVTIIPVNYPPEIKDLPRFVIRYDEPYTFDLRFYISDPDHEIHELTITTCSPEYVTVQGTRLTMLYPERMSEHQYRNYTVALVVFVSDGIDTTSAATTVTVGDIYPPELLIPLHDVAFRENERLNNAFNLDNHFLDRQDDTMYYSSGNEHIMVVIHENSSVDFYAPRNWNGQELITIRATNSAGALMEDSLTVTVIPVNNPPQIGDIPRQEGEVGRSWILDMADYIWDVDNETHELMIFTDDVNVQVVKHKLIFHYDHPGTYFVTVEVSDGIDSNVTEIEVLVIYHEESQRRSPFLLILLLTPIMMALLWLYYYMKRHEFTVEDIFLIHDSGVLIKHNTRTLKAERDEDILAGMFLAVSNFVEDAFGGEEKETLKRMEYGEHIVVVHKGHHVILAVFLSGAVPPKLYDSMSNLVADIEERYSGAIEEWSGDLRNLPDMDAMLNSMFHTRGVYERGDWRKKKGLMDEQK